MRYLIAIAIWGCIVLLGAQALASVAAETAEPFDKINAALSGANR